MEAIRKIVTVKDNTLKVTLPDHLNNTEVELIILPIIDKDGTNTFQEPAFDYQTLYGSFKSGLSIDEIDAQLKSLRSEWDRDIS